MRAGVRARRELANKGFEGQMNRIPIGGTVSRAYGFLFGDFGTVIRLTWAPLLLGAAFSYLYGGDILDVTVRAQNDPTVAVSYAPLQFLMGVIAFVTSVMASVALLRVVVFGDRKPGLVVYLWLGGAELRLILVSILLLIAVIAAMIGVALVLGLLAALTAAIPVLSVLLVVGIFALLFAAIWVPLRLSLIAPVIVAEGSLGVERSWALMKGNALQMFVVFLLTYVPYAILSWLVLVMVLGGDLPAWPALPSIGQDAEAAQAASEAFGKAMEQWQIDFIKAMRLHWPEVSVLGFVGNVVSTALWVGMTGSAYNAVAGERQASQFS